MARPAVSGFEAALHAVLGLFPNGNPRISRPAAYGLVTLKGPLQTGFFMRVDGGDAVLSVNGGENVNSVPRTNDEG